MKKLGRHVLIGFLLVIFIVGSAYMTVLCSGTKIVKADDKIEIQTNVNIDDIINNLNQTEITFYDDDEYVYTYEELGIEVTLSDVQKDIIENSFILEMNDITFIYKTDALKDNLEILNNDRYDYTYSYIEKVNDKIIVTDEVEGNFLNINELYEYVKENLTGKPMSINLKDFVIGRDNKKYTQKELEDIISNIIDTHILYDNGFVITLRDYTEFMIVNNNCIEFDDALLEELNSKLIEDITVGLEDYNTIGKDFKFKTSVGEDVIIDKGTWGNKVDLEKEIDYILNKLLNLESEDNRVPVYSVYMGNNIPDTYVEVSINEQHVWYYEDGELIMESGCVTGNKGTMDTPTGIYYIFDKAKNVTFEVGGFSKNWMKFTKRGHGLHDATWRKESEFGTDRYKGHGSHGCVNLPLKFATDLYNTVDLNTCVIIY